MKDVLQSGAWWAADYVDALWWQAKALAIRTDPASLHAGSRAPVVVLPGIYETWTFMQPVIDRLHRRGHPVHVVESLRRSHRPVEEMAERVEEYLEAADLRDVIVVAHSKGGLAGKRVMAGECGDRVRGMLAIATPFGGSRYARFMWLPSLRAFSSRHPSIAGLAEQTEVNSRIVSVYARFDPHIPERSELPGATNIMLDTGGHFRILRRADVLDGLTHLAD
ncbi:esterase/lipase family protein [Demequina activiva]|uniref:Alpha/beta hydrolase n=1 Tax=Demequina activiva TaxID=1582364 RepID=A0A919Q5R5_9MICO|nr:alpha/beta hydrolase [Demequina activiva]GIG54768.1 hypothetical protein Dac01nite_15200 [Demequina activiva]